MKYVDDNSFEIGIYRETGWIYIGYKRTFLSKTFPEFSVLRTMVQLNGCEETNLIILQPLGGILWIVMLIFGHK